MVAIPLEKDPELQRLFGLAQALFLVLDSSISQAVKMKGNLNSAHPIIEEHFEIMTMGEKIGLLKRLDPELDTNLRKNLDQALADRNSLSHGIIGGDGDRFVLIHKKKPKEFNQTLLQEIVERIKKLIGELEKILSNGTPN